jgi:hypothetical protein
MLCPSSSRRQRGVVVVPQLWQLIGTEVEDSAWVLQYMVELLHDSFVIGL